ncbi:MAG TPA: RICIN domain-containing protein, partial [Pyrinomonadaceae bacterium]|nr:RICIN domain-containing protein [Pyrinomonadaceae bacterium]
STSQGQTPNERLNLSAPAQVVSQNPLEPVLRQRVTPPKPDTIRLISNRNFAGIFIVKFVEGSHVRYRDNVFTTSSQEINKEEARRLSRLKLSIEDVVAELEKLNLLVRQHRDRYGFNVGATFSKKGQEPDALFKEKTVLEISAGEELADLDLYYTFAAKDFHDLVVQEKFMNELNKFRSIELVEAAFLTEGASLKTTSSFAMPQARTPDLSTSQGYLDPAPGGIDARYAWTRRGGHGDGVKLIDVEYDWVTDHEDFAPDSTRFWGGRPVCAYDGVNNTTGEGSGGSEHGTAVMGILNAPHNGFGVSGIVPNIRFGLSTVCRPLDWAFAATSHEALFTLFSGESIAGRTHNIVTSYAINDAASGLGRGDVLLVEQHTFGPLSGERCPWSDCSQWEYVAMEYYQHSFDAIRWATARGIIVVEAAGNGGQDLDALRYWPRFEPTVRHSGAILVGASNGNGNLNRAFFSNFGRRIDLNGWGGMVTTLGYGDGPAGRVAPWNVNVINRFYTNNFGGTSSAAPIVAGAVASVQGARRAAGRDPLNSSDMRMLLDQTGTPQTVPGTPEDAALRVQAIGRQPNLRAAFDFTFGTPGRGSFAGAGTYTIQVKHSRKVLDVNIDWFSGQDNGRPLGQFDSHNGDNQKFSVEPAGGGYFTIRAKHSGKCLDVTGWSTSAGTGLQQWQCHGGANQQFAIEPFGDYYRIRARNSGLYFDITGLSLNNSARLQQWPWNGGNNQMFQLIPTR